MLLLVLFTSLCRPFIQSFFTVVLVVGSVNPLSSVSSSRSTTRFQRAMSLSVRPKIASNRTSQRLSYVQRLLPVLQHQALTPLLPSRALMESTSRNKAVETSVVALLTSFIHFGRLDVVNDRDFAGMAQGSAISSARPFVSGWFGPTANQERAWLESAHADSWDDH